jgi:hypothetical protein
MKRSEEINFYRLLFGSCFQINKFSSHNQRCPSRRWRSRHGSGAGAFFGHGRGAAAADHQPRWTFLVTTHIKLQLLNDILISTFFSFPLHKGMEKKNVALLLHDRL